MMRFFTVHERDDDAPAARLLVLPEGFSLWAFLFGPLWALWHGMVLITVGLVALSLALTMGLDAAGLNGSSGTVAQLGLNLLVGLTGHDLRRWFLRRKGWREAGLVSGLDPDGALRRFLDREPELAQRLVS